MGGVDTQLVCAPRHGNHRQPGAVGLSREHPEVCLRGWRLGVVHDLVGAVLEVGTDRQIHNAGLRQAGAAHQGSVDLPSPALGELLAQEPLGAGVQPEDENPRGVHVETVCDERARRIGKHAADASNRRVVDGFARNAQHARGLVDDCDTCVGVDHVGIRELGWVVIGWHAQADGGEALWFRMRTRLHSCVVCSLACALTWATAGSAQPGWESVEGPYLTGHTRLTSSEDFVKAGEAYFSHDLKRVIFQAVPIPEEGQDPDAHYSMYVAELIWENNEPVGLGKAVLLSEPGSANTCGWFHPDSSDRVLFGSTRDIPREDDQPGYQRGTGRYTWAFPSEMTIGVMDLTEDGQPAGGFAPVFERPGYTAEGSWSPDGQTILYAQVDAERSRQQQRPDADLWVYDVDSQKHTRLVTADGYDGGPFFDASGDWICYRSDRRGDNLLQLFVSELERDEDGRVLGTKREIQITDNQHVNWAPFFHPTEPAIVYTTSEMGHFNYELFAVGFDGQRAQERPGKPIRLTNAAGFDGLAVYSPDGVWMMWTSQRTDLPSSKSGSSQLWIARTSGSPLPAPARMLEPARPGLN